jgi:hypothetical protein
LTCQSRVVDCVPPAPGAASSDAMRVALKRSHNSPVFSNTSFTSSDVPTQINDAIQKAEFGNHARPDWHTLLQPAVKTTQRMVLIRGTYRFALNGDGKCCRFVLVDFNTFANELFPPTFQFPPPTTTIVGAEEAAVVPRVGRSRPSCSNFRTSSVFWLPRA